MFNSEVHCVFKSTLLILLFVFVGICYYPSIFLVLMRNYSYHKSYKYQTCFDGQYNALIVLCSFPGAESLFMIYNSILSQHFSNPDYRIPYAVGRLCKSVVTASIALHNKASSVFLPTATKFHYMFNLRDLSNLFQVFYLLLCISFDNYNVCM